MKAPRRAPLRRGVPKQGQGSPSCPEPVRSGQPRGADRVGATLPGDGLARLAAWIDERWACRHPARGHTGATTMTDVAARALPDLAVVIWTGGLLPTATEVVLPAPRSLRQGPCARAAAGGAPPDRGRGLLHPPAHRPAGRQLSEDTCRPALAALVGAANVPGPGGQHLLTAGARRGLGRPRRPLRARALGPDPRPPPGPACALRRRRHPVRRRGGLRHRRAVPPRGGPLHPGASRGRGAASRTTTSR